MIEPFATAMAVVGIIGTIAYMVSNIINSQGMDLALPSLAGVHAMARGNDTVTSPGSSTVNVATSSPSGGEIQTEAVPSNFFDKEDTNSDIPNPTDLLNDNTSVFDQQAKVVHTHAVPVITDAQDVVINGNEFNDATTRLLQIASDLIRQPATSGVANMDKRNAHMQVDVARRILAQVTPLIANSKDYYRDSNGQ